MWNNGGHIWCIFSNGYWVLALLSSTEKTFIWCKRVTRLNQTLLNRYFNSFILGINNSEITCSARFSLNVIVTWSDTDFGGSTILLGSDKYVIGFAWPNKDNNHIDIKIIIQVSMTESRAIIKIAEKFIHYFLQLRYSIIIVQMSKSLTYTVLKLICESRGLSKIKSWSDNITSRFGVDLYVRRLYNNYYNKL